MFGYVLPVKAEMKVRDFETYRSLYCGVCKELGKSYGLASRFLLNYDLVLLAVIADGLSGEQGEVKCEGCFANPLAKRCTKHSSAGLSLAADGLMLLSYQKLCDDLADEKWSKRVLASFAKPLLRRAYKKAAQRLPHAAEVISQQMQNQSAIEKTGCASIDQACEATAHMCAALFHEAGQTDAQKQILSRLGLFAGQIVYLLDAAEDYEEDAKQNRYNMFLQTGLSKAEAVNAAQRRCRMAAGEIALCYNLLDFCQYKDILDNIFFLGLPAGIAQAGTKRNQRRPKHGQIEGI